MITQNNAILVLNAGSSSLKFSLHDADGTLEDITRGQYAGIGAGGGQPVFSATDNVGRPVSERIENPGKAFAHTQALRHLTQWLHDQFGSRLALSAVGHRVTHGGDQFSAPTLITPDVLERLTACIPLAPLHMPHNIEGVRAIAGIFPHLPQVACFDTAFHRNRPPLTERFAIPREYFDAGVRRWGFHGLSYESIASQFRGIAPSVAGGRVIVAHLGSGASLCAMKSGRSIDTTMSFSTLDGIAMSTRCGSLDPGVLLYLLEKMSREELQEMLYHKSGLLGISGISGDMRALLESADPRAAEAVDFYVYRIIREIGSLTAALDGLDAIIFSAGVGEHSAIIRRRICAGLGFLGVAIDPQANERNENCISLPGRTPSVWVIPTDEEGVIASHTYETVTKLPAPSRQAFSRGGRFSRAAVQR
jgi:acetate kinase